MLRLLTSKTIVSQWYMDVAEYHRIKDRIKTLEFILLLDAKPRPFFTQGLYASGNYVGPIYSGVSRRKETQSFTF